METVLFKADKKHWHKGSLFQVGISGPVLDKICCYA